MVYTDGKMDPPPAADPNSTDFDFDLAGVRPCAGSCALVRAFVRASERCGIEVMSLIITEPLFELLPLPASRVL